MQFLCALDTQGFDAAGDPEALLEEFFLSRPLEEKGRLFAAQLIRGVLEKRQRIDTLLSGYLENFSLARTGLVDRNTLRIGTWEIRFHDDVPPVVAINEAIEVARKFGAEDSARFVNGILDRLAAHTARPLRGHGTPATLTPSTGDE